MMRAFDKLPVTVRVQLANSIENWAPQPLLTRYRRNAGDDFAVMDEIARWNKHELDQRTKQRAKASGPYKGNSPEIETRGRKRK